MVFVFTVEGFFSDSESPVEYFSEKKDHYFGTGALFPKSLSLFEVNKNFKKQEIQL